MSKILYCTTCSQGFSRKGSGLRHISTLHQGQGKLVSTIDYMIGRIEGKYFSAESLSYRRNNRRHIQSRPNNLYNNNESSNFSKADPNDHGESIPHEELGPNTISHSENSNIGIKTKRNNSGNTSILTDSETDMVSYSTQNYDIHDLGKLVFDACVRPLLKGDSKSVFIVDKESQLP